GLGGRARRQRVRRRRLLRARPALQGTAPARLGDLEHPLRQPGGPRPRPRRRGAEPAGARGPRGVLPLGDGLPGVRGRPGRHGGPRCRHRLRRHVARRGAYRTARDGALRRGGSRGARRRVARLPRRRARRAVHREHRPVPLGPRRRVRVGQRRLAAVPLAQHGHRLPRHPAPHRHRMDAVMPAGTRAASSPAEVLLTVPGPPAARAAAQAVGALAVAGVPAGFAVDAVAGAVAALVLGGVVLARVLALPGWLQAALGAAMLAAAGASVLGLYESVTWVDIPAHFLLNGLVAASLGTVLLRAGLLADPRTRRG